MSNTHDIDWYIKHRSEHIDELRELCARLAAGDTSEKTYAELLVFIYLELIDNLRTRKDNTETATMKMQLEIIAEAIEKHRKKGVPVPDALRAEKIRLVAGIAQTEQALNDFAYELDAIINELKSLLGGRYDRPLVRNSRGRRSRSPKTGRMVLREQIILALRKFGGRARSTEVIEEIGQQLDGKFLPGDMERCLSTNNYAWQESIRCERTKMRKDGILRSDSPHGYWELSEDSRQWCYWREDDT